MALRITQGRRRPPPGDLALEELLPQNLDAEVALLGSVLIDSSSLPVVAGIARPEDCYREAHRTIYQAMCDLYDAGTPPDLVTVCDELARRGKLDEIGGISYVNGLANHVPTCLHGERYVGIVAAKRTLRGLIEAAGKIAALPTMSRTRKWR